MTLQYRSTPDSVLLGTAGLFETRSTCDRNHVGVVIAKDNRIISTGYNGAPAGLPHCDHTYRETSRTVPGYALGASSQRGCTIAIHAEANAIAYAARHGTSVEGATLYTTLSPCWPCAQLIISAGLVRVVYGRRYRDPAGIELLVSANLEVELLQT